MSKMDKKLTKKMKLIGKPVLFPPQIKITLQQTIKAVLKEDKKSVKEIASEYLQLKRDGKIPDGYARSLMIEALPEKFMVVHRSLLSDYAKANSTEKSLILTNKYVQKLLNALSNSSSPKNYKKIQAEEIWSDLTETKLNFSLDTYLSFLKCFAEVGDKSMMEKMHDMMVRMQERNPWGRNIYAGLIAAHHSFGNKYAIKRLFEAYEKQFAPLAKYGFLDPLNDNVNVQLKGMIAQYFEALINAGNHQYLAVLLDKISRITSDEMYARLNEHAYEAIFKSLTETQNSDLAKRYFKILKYHQKCVPLKYTIFYSALNCASKICSFKETNAVYGILNESRIYAIIESNKKENFNHTPSEITKMFMDYIATSKPQSKLELFRNWNSPLPPLKVQAMMAFSVGKTLNVNLIRSFFQSQILTKEYLQLHWSRQVSSNLRKLSDLLTETQSKLDAMRSKPEQNLNTKSATELKTTISWINRRRKRGLAFVYGQSGPLCHVYTALVDGWQDSLERGMKVSDPLEFDILLQELENFEKEIVLESEIGKYLAVKVDPLREESAAEDIHGNSTEV